MLSARASTALWLWVLSGASVGCAREASSVEQFEIALLRAVGSDVLYDVQDAALTRRGDVVVLSRTHPFLRVYDSAGRVVAVPETAAGRGPSDLFAPRAVTASQTSDTIWILDAGTRKLLPIALGEGVGIPVALGVAGPGRASADIERTTFGRPYAFTVSQDHIILASYPLGLSLQRDYESGELLAMQRSAVRVDTLARLGSGSEDDGVRRDASTQYRALVASPMWAPCAGDTVAVYDHVSNAVTWLRPGEGVLRSTKTMIDAPRLPVSHVRLYLLHQASQEAPPGTPQEEIVRRVDAVLSEARAVFPPTAPAVVSMLCDSDGRVWLQPFQVDVSPLGYGEQWEVLHLGGQSRARVRVPRGVRLRGVRPNGMVGVRDRDDGFQEVVVLAPLK